jgi:hypothetical protein
MFSLAAFLAVVLKQLHWAHTKINQPPLGYMERLIFVYSKTYKLSKNNHLNGRLVVIYSASSFHHSTDLARTPGQYEFPTSSFHLPSTVVKETLNSAKYCFLLQ